MCFPFSPGKRETHKQFDPHPFPGQSREIVYVYWFFCPPDLRTLQGNVSRHGLLDMVYSLREHPNNVHLMLSGECCGGVFPDTACWIRLRNTWLVFPTIRVLEGACLGRGWLIFALEPREPRDGIWKIAPCKILQIPVFRGNHPLIETTTFPNSASEQNGAMEILAWQ